ncbi:CocE/NonD family hydrolase [Herbaspirillum sp. meg3]|uniref:CocE/NonD family hydrolase n=1 Tax=Herbaspirillum sp. meg3 TaxID=2025949 RepID=UPI0018E033D7|nr:CocE/NonD family hydrolase [Herbaspirillum sp. meg3]
MQSLNHLSRSPAGEMTVLRDIMVLMRDGVQLATDVYLPAGAAATDTFPVILERTPYGKNQPSRAERNAINETPLARAEVAAYFVVQGYAVVYQDCRGRYQSGGSFVKYTSDSDDGYDTCAWILTQAWCNGCIGTKGLSYAAHTQAALGSLGAPGVVAMFLDSGGFSNAFQGGIRQGGAFELKQATWAWRQALESRELQEDPERFAALSSIDLDDWFTRTTEWKPGNSPLSSVPEYEAYMFEQWRHGEFDDYWMQPGLYAEGYYPQFCNAAMVHMSSWFDPYPRTATTNYTGLIKAGKGPVRLILGPWTHGNRSITYAGDVDFGAAATLDGQLARDYLSLRLQWFDRWLKNDATVPDPLPPVSLFVMGGGSGKKNAAGRLDHGGRWRSEQQWPLPDAQAQVWYLRREGALSTTAPGPVSKESDAFLAYRYDPLNPVPTIGGAVTSGEPLMFGGAFDQCEGPGVFGATLPYYPLAMRADVLVFQTPVLTQDVEVTGDISVKLWISSDCLDTDFTFKLIDVYPPSADYPNGYAMNLSHGILRARYRNSWEAPALMIPGAVYEINIDGFPTSNLFQKGHRIRLDISSSNFPHFDCNPNTGEPEGAATHTRVATNRIYLDATRPSQIVLPVIPARKPTA